MSTAEQGRPPLPPVDLIGPSPIEGTPAHAQWMVYGMGRQAYQGVLQQADPTVVIADTQYQQFGFLAKAAHLARFHRPPRLFTPAERWYLRLADERKVLLDAAYAAIISDNLKLNTDPVALGISPKTKADAWALHEYRIRDQFDAGALKVPWQEEVAEQQLIDRTDAYVRLAVDALRDMLAADPGFQSNESAFTVDLYMRTKVPLPIIDKLLPKLTQANIVVYEATDWYAPVIPNPGFFNPET